MNRYHPFVSRIIRDNQNIQLSYEHEVMKYAEEDVVKDCFGDETINHKMPSFCAQLMALGWIVSDLGRQNDLATLVRILDCIESELQIADEQCKEIFEVCFFESFLNAINNLEISKKDQIVSAMGPISLSLCKKNDNFWGVKSF